MTSPFTIPQVANCAECGDTSLKAFPPDQAPSASTHYICVHCAQNGITPSLLAVARAQCSEILGYIQAGQSDPALYEMVRNLQVTLDNATEKED